MRVLRLSPVLLGIVLVMQVPQLRAESLGDISFPTSASPQAQQHFLRGAAILHSFGWKQAIDAFREAQRLEPDFALAYWGETLCYNHPLFAEQDAESPRAALARLGPDRAARLAKARTAREKGLLNAVEELWAPGPDWRARRLAYLRAMEALHAQYPADDEIAIFHALALLGSSSATGDESLRPEIRAGAIALEVNRRNPRHPGALHFIIHAFDDPLHAPLALEAAEAYARTVPDVSHAVHMPTHIFIQLGRWHEVAHQNVRAFEVARALWRDGDNPGDMLHAGDWSQYGFLQMGDLEGARERMRAFERLQALAPKNERLPVVRALLEARWIVETQNWRVQELANDAAQETIYANGLSALRLGKLDVAERMIALLAARIEPGARQPASESAHAGHGPAPAAAPVAAKAAPMGRPNRGEPLRAMHRQLAALLADARGRRAEAIELLREAVKIESGMRAPRGAADPIQPSHELLGELLLLAGQHAEAAAAFDASLLRMPNRPRGLLGSARAHAALGDQRLAEQRRATLLGFWKGGPIGGIDPRQLARSTGSAEPGAAAAAAAR